LDSARGGIARGKRLGHGNDGAQKSGEKDYHFSLESQQSCQKACFTLGRQRLYILSQIKR
jgi:hypothetical protein